MQAIKKSWKAKFIKASIMMMGAAMTMGNQKCEQKQTEEPKTRALKKIVEVGALRSSPVNFPGGSFDFQFVANQQIYSVLLDSDKFTFKYNPPIATPSGSTINGQKISYNLTSGDRQRMEAYAQAAAQKGNHGADLSQVAWCMVNLPQVKIRGSVNSFELIGGGGLMLGFNSGGSHSTSGISGLGFDVSFAQLDLSLYGIAPLTDKVLGGGTVKASQTKTKVSFQLNFGGLAVGPSAYYQTPLAQVTKKALEKAVDTLSQDLDSREVWYTRVMADYDTHLVIVGGTDVGLEEGDELLVYNEDYTWSGEPCNSTYLGGMSGSGSAVAKIRIDRVGDQISRGKVIEQNDYAPEVGAKVKLFKFHPADYVPEGPGVDNGTVVGGG